MSRSSFIYSEAAYATALDASIGAERKGPHVPFEAPGESYDKDKDYQLERALDVLRAGGDLTRLADAPDTVVVTPPGTVAVAEATNDDLPEGGVRPADAADKPRSPEIVPGEAPTPQQRR